MEVAIVTVGDELLAGETENTNASWLARELSDRGATVSVIVTVGDDRGPIAEFVSRFRDEFDRVVVTGGLGGTHDDVTMAAVADALDRELAVDEDVRAEVTAASRDFVAAHPELEERYDLGLDVEAWSETVAGGRPLENPAGLSPGCAVENVYVLPGVPSELRATFDLVADEFGGDRRSVTRYTDAPEGALQSHLEALEARFDVRAGSYPGEHADRNRVRLVAGDEDTLESALAWLADRIALEEA
jgi:molybdenum cofactor synthesis domain-containing protein